ncbi:phosphoribosyl-AMP cyclohydrolase [bacterium]|nr:phosphoribosyl-AMP cyclohydrolase [bacterium]MBU3955956.1 phosphoribosyl-AMP cyclohydrolase [bacterium]
MALINEIKFDSAGLVPAVAVDEKGSVLMLAYMNREAFEKTIATGKTTFYSRSRKKLWTKGEESGNVLEVLDIYLDCDGDAIVVKVKSGVPACHKGYASCFFRKYSSGGKWKIFKEKVFDPEKAYKKRGE